jgi:uncharacterized membrane protein
MTEIAYGQPETIGLVDHPAIFPFDFYISPNISLGRLGSVIVLLTAALPAAGIGSACAMMGHWPVTIFGGLTFGRRLLSFVQDRRSLCRLKRASLSKGHVVIERTSSAGPRSCIRVPLLGLHLERFVDPDYGVLSVVLRHRDQRTEVARDLSPPERERFGAAFVHANDAVGFTVSIHTVTGLSHRPPESAR